jgi:hypothetical protein
MACPDLHRLPHNSSGEASSDVDPRGKLVNKRGPNSISSNAAMSDLDIAVTINFNIYS